MTQPLRPCPGLDPRTLEALYLNWIDKGGFVFKKLEDIKNTGALFLVIEGPGCILQLRGGIHHRGEAVEVLHLAELLERP